MKPGRQTRACSAVRQDISRRGFLALLVGGAGALLSSCRREHPISSDVTFIATVTQTAGAPVTTIAPGPVQPTTTITVPLSRSAAVTTSGVTPAPTFILRSEELVEGGALPREYT